MPTYFAHADILGIGSFASSAIGDLIKNLLWYMFSLVGGLIAVMAHILDFSVKVRAGGSVPVVAATWKILRDFSNMLFVVILIYMAFSTIFNRASYNFQSLIVRFIIVAVLINFSLVLGNIVIDFCQVLTNVFLGSIGSLGDRLGTYLNPSALLPANVNLNSLDMAGGGVLSLLFALIMACIFLFSLAVAAAFSIIRIPYIWGLLILSPFAWMTYIFPGASSAKFGFKAWWGQFLGWNLFLPVYLFYMYLGLMFLSKRNDIINQVIQVNGTGANPANSPLLGGFTNSLSFNLLFFYIFAGFVMVGGVAAAKSTTSWLGGRGFEGGVERARGWVRKIPGVSDYFAAKNSAQKRVGEVGQYFKAQQQAQQARYDRLLGVGGSSSQQKGFVNDIKKTYDDIEDRYDTGKLNIKDLQDKVTSTKADSAEGYAYRKFALKKGAIDDDQFKQTLLAIKDNPYAVNDFIKTARDAKYAGIKDLKSIVFDKRFDGIANMLPARRELLLEMADDAKKVGKFDDTDVNEAVELLGKKDSPEAKKFLDDLAKNRPELVARYRSRTSGKNVLGELFKMISSSDPKKLAAIPMVTWKDPDFQKTLKLKIRQLSKVTPPLPEGDLYPAGTTVPPAYAASAVALPDGSNLIPGKPGSSATKGVSRKFKGRQGGGEKFKSQLENATTSDVQKNRIIGTL
jgi:hypothetical protein